MTKSNVVSQIASWNTKGTLGKNQGNPNKVWIQLIKKKKERSYGIKHPGNANQNHNEISPHINENDHQQKKKKEEDISVDERVDKKGKPRAPLMGMQIGTTTLKISVELL